MRAGRLRARPGAAGAATSGTSRPQRGQAPREPPGRPPARASLFSSRTNPVTKSTGQVMCLVPLAPEAGAMGASARPTHAMAADAELLSRAAVAARARGRIDARLHAVVPPAGSRGDPSERMRATRRRARADVLAIVAALAGVLAVARRAEPRVCARLVRVACAKPGPMEAGQGHVVERQHRRECRDGAHAVARGA
jgi:hypothetical protein